MGLGQRMEIEVKADILPTDFGVEGSLASFRIVASCSIEKSTMERTMKNTFNTNFFVDNLNITSSTMK